jgi:hypothetical protein
MNRYQMRVELTIDCTAFDSNDAIEAVKDWFSEGEVPGNQEIFICDSDVYGIEELR